MRILIHTDEYYPTAQACSYRMRTMADAFIDQGDEVVVIASSTNKGNGKIEPRREKILYSPAIRMKKKTTVMRMLNNLSFGFTSIFTALKAGKVDVVITTSPPPLVSIPGWIIAKCKGAKLVYDVRDIWPDVALEMRHMFKAIRRVMDEHPDVKAIYPIHMNPVVREIANEYLGDDDRIHIIEPLDVLDFHNFLSRSYLILTDSGGIQEEAPSLGKPVLVMRDTTERPEGIAAGTLKLVGTEEETIYKEFSRLLSDKDEYEAMSKASNPYGDGHACERIADVLCKM